MMMSLVVFCLYGKWSGGQSNGDKNGEWNVFHEQKSPWKNDAELQPKRDEPVPLLTFTLELFLPRTTAHLPQILAWEDF
jgi:hypothetical protein